jgi:hypothetical protein
LLSPFVLNTGLQPTVEAGIRSRHQSSRPGGCPARPRRSRHLLGWYVSLALHASSSVSSAVQLLNADCWLRPCCSHAVDDDSIR